MAVTKKSLPKFKKRNNKTKNKIENKIKKKMKKKILSNRRRYIRKNKSKRKGRKNNLSKNQMIQKGGYMVRNFCGLGDSRTMTNILYKIEGASEEIKIKFPELNEDFGEIFIQQFINTHDELYSNMQDETFHFDINENIYNFINNNTEIYHLIAEHLRDYVLNYYFEGNYGPIKEGNLNTNFKDILIYLLEIDYYLNLPISSLGYAKYCPSGLDVNIKLLDVNIKLLVDNDNLDNLKSKNEDEKKILDKLKNNKSLNIHKFFLFINYLDFIIFILEKVNTPNPTAGFEYMRIKDRYFNTRRNIKEVVVDKKDQFDFSKIFAGLKGNMPPHSIGDETERKTFYENRYEGFYNGYYRIKNNSANVFNNKQTLDLLKYYRNNIINSIFFEQSDLSSNSTGGGKKKKLDVDVESVYKSFLNGKDTYEMYIKEKKLENLFIKIINQYDDYENFYNDDDDIVNEGVNGIKEILNTYSETEGINEHLIKILITSNLKHLKKIIKPSPGIIKSIVIKTGLLLAAVTGAALITVLEICSGGTATIVIIIYAIIFFDVIGGLSEVLLHSILELLKDKDNRKQKKKILNKIIEKIENDDTFKIPKDNKKKKKK